jgi:hypothetical protein
MTAYLENGGTIENAQAIAAHRRAGGSNFSKEKIEPAGL